MSDVYVNLTSVKDGSMKLMPVRNPHAALAALFVAVKTCVALQCFFSDDKAVRVLGGPAFVGGMIFLGATLLVVRHPSSRGIWIKPDNYGMLRGFLLSDLVMNCIFFLGQTVASWVVFFSIVACDLLALAHMAASKTEATYPRGL